MLAIIKSVSMTSIHGVLPTLASTLGWKAVGQTSITANGRSALCRRMLSGQLIYIFSQLIFIEPWWVPGTGLRTRSKAINKTDKDLALSRTPTNEQ